MELWGELYARGASDRVLCMMIATFRTCSGLCYPVSTLASPAGSTAQTAIHRPSSNIEIHVSGKGSHGIAAFPNSGGCFLDMIYVS